MLIIRLLVCAGLLAVSGAALWAALRSRQRDLQLGAVAVASVILVYSVVYKPAGVTKHDIVPGTVEEAEPDE